LLDKIWDDFAPDRFVQLVRKPFSMLIFLGFVFFAFLQIKFPSEHLVVFSGKIDLNIIAQKLYQASLIVVVFWIFVRLCSFLGEMLMKKADREENKFAVQLVPFMIDSLKVLVIVFGLLIILANVFKINILGLLAGLSIGALALALAAQETLANLLGSVTIFVDKPFKVGDLISVGGIIGTVEKVGFRSTRVRTLEKSYVTIPNKKMVDTELDNLSERTFRRLDFNIGVTYSTTSQQIKAIVDDVQKFVDESNETDEKGHVKFFEFGDSSLNIRVIAFSTVLDWAGFLNYKETLNHKIVEIVHKHGSSFAFPSMSVYMEKS
jgi:MscS family membrane protein